MDITTIFNQFAFPVAVVMALMWYIVKTDQSHRETMRQKDEQIAALNAQHSAESSEFTAALNRNTVVLERLCTMLGDKEGTDHGNQQISDR